MFEKIFHRLIIVSLIAAALGGCAAPGFADPSTIATEDGTSVLWDLKKEQTARIDDIYQNIKANDYSDYTPDNLTEDNFVAYYAYAGTSSVNDRYLICKVEGGAFRVYNGHFDCGQEETYGGTCKDTRSFLRKVSEADSMMLAPTMDGDYSAYAYLYYIEEGKTVRCTVENVFEA